MITITIIGLDPYLVRQISKELTENIANLYEVSKDEVNFYAPECLYIHDGVEQNTWNTLVKVNAPLKVKIHTIEEQVAKLISTGLKNATINTTIEFYYYSLDNRYVFNNDEYPRFITEQNVVYEEDDFDEEEIDEEDLVNEVCLDNMFEGFEKKLKEE